jgi:hypothetical protein
MITIDQQISGNQNRRIANQNRMDLRADVMGTREDAAEELVGKLCSEGKTVFYINQRNKDGKIMNSIKKFEFHFQAVEFLLRNNYL